MMVEHVEILQPLRAMRPKRVVGPDCIPVELWNVVGNEDIGSRKGGCSRF